MNIHIITHIYVLTPPVVKMHVFVLSHSVSVLSGS